MHKPTPHKELQDPFYHYTRGVLYFDEEHFTFTAYRMPYQELNDKSWTTEREFQADYLRLIEKRFLV